MIMGTNVDSRTRASSCLMRRQGLRTIRYAWQRADIA